MFGGQFWVERYITQHPVFPHAQVRSRYCPDVSGCSVIRSHSPSRQAGSGQAAEVRVTDADAARAGPPLSLVQCSPDSHRVLTHRVGRGFHKFTSNPPWMLPLLYPGCSSCAAQQVFRKGPSRPFTHPPCKCSNKHKPPLRAH